MLSHFDQLLEDLSKKAELGPLKADENNRCLIVLKNSTQIQLELDRSGTNLMIGSFLGTLVHGKYRENIFREALRANDLPFPRYGDFSYSKKKNMLVMHSTLRLESLTGDKLATFFNSFAEKATTWREAIDRGDIPPLIGNYTTHQAGRGMFGL